MKVSVIITTYNNPVFLKKVLNGFLIQKKTPDEIIVADDGSGEDTAQLLKRFSELLPFPLLHVWQENRGFRAAKIRNEAIKQATGDYLIFLDGDCIPNRHFIADHMHLAESGFFFQGKRLLLNKEAGHDFEAYHINSPVKLLSFFFHGTISNAHHLFRIPFFPSLINTSLRGIKSCNMAGYLKDLLAVNGFNEDFVGWGREDSEIAARLYKYGLKRKMHPFRAICFHLWHKENARDGLEANEKLLSETVGGKNYWCRNGIQKKDNP